MFTYQKIEWTLFSITVKKMKKEAGHSYNTLGPNLKIEELSISTYSSTS